jgi:hypothetical protein
LSFYAGAASCTANYQKIKGCFDAAINKNSHHYFQTEQRSPRAKINFDFNQAHTQSIENQANPILANL